MKRGTASEQKEQWDIFSKLVESFSTHIEASKDQMIVEHVPKEKRQKRAGIDGEPLDTNFNHQRAVVQQKPEEVIEIAAGSTYVAEI